METAEIIGYSVGALFYLILLWDNAVMTFKVSYYEETLKQHKHMFRKSRYENIEKVMKSKKPYIKP